MATPRGIRNNNPLNIRRNGSHWVGLRPKQTDPDFFQFQTMAWGFRAAFRILRTYWHAYGLHTVKQIITRWAPPNENATSSYVQTVLGGLAASGYVVDDKTPVEAPENNMRLWCAFARAMFKAECGSKAAALPTVANDIVQGYRLAFPNLNAK